MLQEPGDNTFSQSAFALIIFKRDAMLGGNFRQNRRYQQILRASTPNALNLVFESGNCSLIVRPWDPDVAFTS